LDGFEWSLDHRRPNPPFVDAASQRVIAGDGISNAFGFPRSVTLIVSPMWIHQLATHGDPS
jgi:hypothetical protein